jgi:hypothetical protein
MSDERLRVTIPDNDGSATGKGRGADDVEREIEQIRRRTVELNQQAAQSRAETARIRAYAAEQREQAIGAGIDTARFEVENAKRDFEDSMNSGDFAKASEAQRRIADATVRTQRLEEARSHLQQQQQFTAPQSTGDVVEDFCLGRSAATQQWIRQHPEMIRDQKKLLKLQAAHYDAVANDLTPDTNEYFTYVEKQIGLRPNQPVKRSSDPRAHVRGNQVFLTPGEARTATDGTLTWSRNDLAAGRIKDPKLVGEPIGTTEMARRKKIMTGQGYYSQLSDLDK